MPAKKREPGDRCISHLLREAAEPVYLAMMRSIVDHADQNKAASPVIVRD